MYGIVINKQTGLVIDKCVLLLEDGTADGYILTDSEEVIPFDLELGNPVGAMNKPRWSGREWVETEELPSVEPLPPQPDKISVRLGQIEQAMGVLATQVAKNTLLQNQGGMK